MVLGYDPLFQFLFESDAARAITLSAEQRVKGIFNVAGPNPVPLRLIIEHTGRTAVPVPEMLLRGLLGRFGLPRLPTGALEHIKYPIVVDGKAFRRATGFSHEVDEVETLQRYRLLTGR
jgi:UDP-glucose 4-epimerase